MHHENEAKRELRRMNLNFHQKRKREEKRNTFLSKNIVYEYFKLIPPFAVHYEKIRIHLRE